MAILRNGILGTVTGKVGTVVGSTWRGKNVVKSYNPSPRNPQTEGQTTQRNAFSKVVTLVKIFLQFVKAVNMYKPNALPGYNIAVSKTLQKVKDENIILNVLSATHLQPLQSFDKNIQIGTVTKLAATAATLEIVGMNLDTDCIGYTIVQSSTNLSFFEIVPISSASVFSATEISVESTVIELTNAPVIFGVVVYNTRLKELSSYATKSILVS